MTTQETYLTKEGNSTDYLIPGTFPFCVSYFRNSVAFLGPEDKLSCANQLDGGDRLAILRKHRLVGRTTSGPGADIKENSP
jgi:hypothetical protein